MKWIAFGLALLTVPSMAIAAPGKTAPKSDLATQLSGTWFGDVISDSQGSSRSDVTLTITRVGPNRISISSDYPRLPVIEVPIGRVMAVIMQQSGNSVFLYDPTKSPPRLDVSFNNEVSWSGTRQE